MDRQACRLPGRQETATGRLDAAGGWLAEAHPVTEFHHIRHRRLLWQLAVLLWLEFG
jgi:hypothetical protein